MNDINLCEIENHLDYLQLLSNQFPAIPAVCTEIINLQAILNLPKETEHFLTDIHGEYESFIHVLRNASGVLKIKINEIFGDELTDDDKKGLATLLYYPEQKLEIVKKQETNMRDWYKATLSRLIRLCRVVASKYTRSKVRKALPQEFAYVIEELLHENENRLNKQEYYNQLINTMIDIDRAEQFIAAIAKLIQRLAVDRLHIVGDIYDRGPGAHIVLDRLMAYHSVDIQWGNHDILWMGAAGGSNACIANVIRICTRYANMETIEEGYGINMLPLARFAVEYYGDDPCVQFQPKVSVNTHHSEKDLRLIAKMHKAIAIIQFKLEGQLIQENPQYQMEKRLLLDKMDYQNGTIKINSKSYPLNDTYFPTIDRDNPYQLTDEEEEVVAKLHASFINSEKLQKHVRFLYSKGSMYLKYNSNLLYHACIPMNADGTFKDVFFGNNSYQGKELLDLLDRSARDFYFYQDNFNKALLGTDIMWYLWCGEYSPLFGKDQMTTLERYFIDEKETHTENKNPYFRLRDDETCCNYILNNFGLDSRVAHIINGHVPVKAKKGESPIKANGKLLVIDGGFARAYQPTTGIAGYTLIYNSYGLLLVSHGPFESTGKAITEGQDILSTMIVLEKVNRKYISDTDLGLKLKEKIKYLKMLLMAYRKGMIKEQQ